MDEEKSYEMTLTDEVRKNLIAYIWDDDEIACSRNLESIFDALHQIDKCIENLKEDVKDERHKRIRAQVELGQKVKELEALKESPA